MDTVDISQYLAPERVAFLEQQDKRGALAELAALLAPAVGVDDVPKLLELVLQRESLMSTGIGLGIGVPHVRMDGIQRLAMCIGVCRQGIADYESLDDLPVCIVVMIGGGPTHHRAYIRLLGVVTQILKPQPVRDAILAAAAPAEVYTRLVNARG